MFGCGLGAAQRVRVYHVELDVVGIHLEITPNEVGQFFDAFFSGEQGRRELDIEQRTTRFDVIHLCRGFEDGRGALSIRTLDGRDPFGKRSPGRAAVRCGTGDAAKIDVACCREHIDVILAAAAVGAILHGFEESLEATDHDIVHHVVIVTILGRFIEENLTQFFPPLIVVFKSIQQLIKGKGFIPEDVLLDGCETIGECSDTDTLDIARVVTGTARIVVLRILDAVVEDDGKKRSGRVVCIHLLEDVVAAELDLNEVIYLSAPSFEEMFERMKLARNAGFWAELLTGTWVETVGQCNLQNLDKIKIAGKDKSFLAEGPRLDATTRTSFSCVLHGLALSDELLHNGVGVEYGRKSVALSNDASSSF